jgi:hypothetical protein
LVRVEVGENRELFRCRSTTDSFQLSFLLTYSLKRAPARPRFSPRSDGRAVDWPSAYATVSPNRSWHHCSPLPFYLTSLVIGRPLPLASPVFSLASELSPPPMGPCNPQLQFKYVGRPLPSASPVFSLASELSPPPMGPCNPQLQFKYVSPYRIRFH